MFSDQFIDDLPDDAFKAARLLCDEFSRIDANIHPEEEISEENYLLYIRAYGICIGLIEACKLGIFIPSLSTDNRKQSIGVIRGIVSKVSKLAENAFIQSTIQTAQLKFATKMGKAFHYEFSEGDIVRGQTLLNEIRDLITTSSVFDESHKRRLLARLERVQSELHKKVSDLDRFWGLIGEAGVVLGKFGNDAKPIVDRIRELTSLVWVTQSRAEGLPSNSPPPLSLPPPSPEVPPTPAGSEPPSIDV
jgi:hypothetical protein